MAIEKVSIMAKYQATEELARDISQRIVDFCQPERIILFGSLARGSVHPEADIDLLVVWDSRPPMDVKERYAAIRNAIGSAPVAIDLIPYTSGEFDAAMRNPLSFTAQVAREGRVLYERLH